MNNKSKFSLFTFVLLLLMMPLSSGAQIVRTITNTTNNSVSYIRIYEYNTIDANPEFPGGNMELIRFINHERHYPHQAYDEGIEGRVVCGFVVDTDGSISNISVLKSVEESLDREAVRIIGSMPRWISGLVNDEPVPVYCTLTIPFRR